ncbi:hypothetical protein FB451DRAFT_1557014 [Mycena latifolia]|nr:hypothetical protein FB451DRAFT_1557014 [Mycena latifolia]
MKLTLALLAPFVAVAVANPIADAIPRVAPTCDIGGFLCTGGIAQQEFCLSLYWKCQAAGQPIISPNATCEADCSCPCQ